MDSNTSKYNGKLASPLDWPNWDNEFKTKAVAYRLWEHIDPSCEETPLARRPVPPMVSDFPKEIVSTPQQTPTQSVSEGGQSQAGSVEDRPRTPARSFAELSAADQLNFWHLRSNYDNDYKRYEMQQERIGILKLWVQDTVALQFRKTCCKPTGTLREWYSKLRDRLGLDDTLAKNLVLESYKDAVRPLVRPPKDFLAWLTNWRSAIDEALDKGLAEAIYPVFWYQSFTEAIIQVKPFWVADRESLHIEKIRTGHLSHKALADDFQDELLRDAALAKKAVANGSFGHTFDGSSENDKSEISGTDSKDSSQETRKRKRFTSKCAVCERRFCTNMATCYYANPDRAPRNWNPNSRIQELAKKNLEKQSVKDKLAEAKTKRIRV